MKEPMEDPTRRFTERAEGYARYRPGYPEGFIDSCVTRVPPPAAVADIGSGTGILSRPFLERGYPVWAVEPNDAMRRRAETDLSGEENFHSVRGRGESTNLDDHTCRLVCCAQSFHWFANEVAVREISRVTQIGGIVCLVWNRRRTDDPFSSAYHELIERYAVSIGRADHRDLLFDTISSLFEGRTITHERFDNVQKLEWDALWGRVQSSSYAPGPDHPSYEPLRREMRKLFDAQSKRPIEFFYDTEAYFIEI